MPDPSRRDFLASLGIAALQPLLHHPVLAGDSRVSPEAAAVASGSPSPAARGVRVRAITAGVAMERRIDRASVERALEVLARARARFEHEGYEVETTRVTMTPVVAALDAEARRAALPAIADVDALIADRGAVCSLGPVLMSDRLDPEIFCRVHKQAILQLSCARELHSLAGGHYLLRLSDGSEVQIGRNYARDFRARFG